MKKAFLFLALTAAVTLAGAQGKFFSEVSLGTTSYLGYSGLSLLPDANKGYTALNASFTMGLRHHGNKSIGLRFDANQFNTSAISTGETCGIMSLSLYQSSTLSLTKRIDAVFGCGFGAIGAINTLTLPGEATKQYFRWGIVGQFEVGLNYNISENKFIGLRAGYSGGALFSTTTPLPDGVERNKLSGFSALQTGITIGFKF